MRRRGLPWRATGGRWLLLSPELPSVETRKVPPLSVEGVTGWLLLLLLLAW